MPFRVANSPFFQEIGKAECLLFEFMAEQAAERWRVFRREWHLLGVVALPAETFGLLFAETLNHVGEGGVGWVGRDADGFLLAGDSDEDADDNDDKGNKYPVTFRDFHLVRSCSGFDIMIVQRQPSGRSRWRRCAEGVRE